MEQLREFLALEPERAPSPARRPPRPLRSGVRFEDVSFQYPGADGAGARRRDLHAAPARTAGAGRRERRRQDDPGAAPAGALPPDRRHDHRRRDRPVRAGSHGVAPGGDGGLPGLHALPRHRGGEHRVRRPGAAPGGAARRRGRWNHAWSPPPSRAAPTGSFAGCRPATPRSSAPSSPAPWICRPDSGSGWRLPAPICGTRRSSSWTSRRRRSTRAPRWPSTDSSATPPAAAARSSSPTGWARRASRIGSSSCAAAELVEEGTHDALQAGDGEYARMFRLQASWYRDTPEQEARSVTGGTGRRTHLAALPRALKVLWDASPAATLAVGVLSAGTGLFAVAEVHVVRRLVETAGHVVVRQRPRGRRSAVGRGRGRSGGRGCGSGRRAAAGERPAPGARAADHRGGLLPPRAVRAAGTARGCRALRPAAAGAPRDGPPLPGDDQLLLVERAGRRGARLAPGLPGAGALDSPPGPRPGDHARAAVSDPLLLPQLHARARTGAGRAPSQRHQRPAAGTGGRRRNSPVRAGRLADRGLAAVVGAIAQRTPPSGGARGARTGRR